MPEDLGGAAGRYGRGSQGAQWSAGLCSFVLECFFLERREGRGGDRREVHQGQPKPFYSQGSPTSGKQLLNWGFSKQ